ncbi:ABC transporter ATP-binding protein [Maritimibacter sp. UBA3975]|uniref:ABC transporter ATP-binding protein n=1 Tax=Maritimibacter sp. UBA3975 TaxID=1946833 RepID=UPI000C0B7277|nr:ABC transporter ATP-binding protein [Maritimibacter sp. UBA3975]MAM60044.1 ABC transporter ATP-binding protein [Maritimibacter sp.]|tara:strand:- start:575 stop:1288 length:714 start_codon:yes stop_codon:yes gene_type:complete
MADPILSLDNVVAGYGDTTVLHGVSFDVPKGQRLAIIGRNGVGKTTLLGTIMGLTQLHSGHVAMGGRVIDRVAPHRRAGTGLGLVPQTRDIFPSLSVEENLLSGLRGDATLEEAFALFPRLKERRRNGGGQLSGGEQQMLAIARTLMGRPEVLMLDEPLEGLAPVICDMLMETFETLSADGRHTLLLVEQHTELALDFADRVIILDAGEIVQDASAEALRADPSIIERHVGVGLAGA